VRAITVGFACNNACVFCAQGDLGRGPPPEDTGERVLRALAETQPGETVALLGGEPTLFDALPAWIRAAGARGAAHVVVQTNGRRLAYRAFAAALRAASPRLSLDVSLQGSTAAMHDWHTGTAGSFAQTVQGIRNARAEGIPVGVTVVVTRSNFRHLGEIVRVARAAGALAVHFSPVELHGRAARDGARLVPAAELVAPYQRRAAAEAGRLGLGVQVGMGTGTGTGAGPAGVVFFAGLGEVEPPAPGGGPVVVEEAP
jgi:MoaA/NifB/PqqE/SkfB family radical SAM enzyme